MRVISKLLWFSAAALGLAGCLAIFPGCAGAKVKKAVAQDLQALVDMQDCPTICEQLETYIKTKLAQ